MATIEERRATVNARLAALATARGVVAAGRAERFAARQHAAYAVEAHEAGQAIALAVQQRVHDRLAPVVTRCLAAVFDDPYEFNIGFERKRGRTETPLSFIRNGYTLDPLEAAGGGAVDVAAFGLRLACLMLQRPAPRRLIVMDEPFKFLHNPVWRARACDLMVALANELGVQFIMVTGEQEFEIGKVIHL